MRLVGIDVLHFIGMSDLCRRCFRFGWSGCLKTAYADPQPSEVLRVFDIEKALRLARRLQFVLRAGQHRQWRRLRQIETTRLILRAIPNHNRDEPALLDFSQLSRVLQNRRRAQVRTRLLLFLIHTAWILSARGQSARRHRREYPGETS